LIKTFKVAFDEMSSEMHVKGKIRTKQRMREAKTEAIDGESRKESE
jgi:hypothetical protein